jgi:diguanylate cyclase (GGDEF)-like protein/PAS domain S-box-containing protein
MSERETEAFGPDTPLYNSRIICAYVGFLKANYSYVDIDELLSYAGMHEYQVQDETYWFTQEQTNRFHERVIQYTGDNGIARKAGRHAASAECLGPIKSYAARFLSPASFCEVVGRANSYLTRSNILDARQTGPNAIEVVSRQKPGVEEQQFQCDNRMGIIEAAFSLMRGKFPTVEETECFFRGGECCRYLIKWPEFKSAKWRRRRNWATLPVAVLSALLFIFSSYESLALFLGMWCFTALALSIRAGRMERRECLSILETQKSMIDSLLDKAQVSDNNTHMTQEIGRVLTGQDSVPAVIHEVTQIFEKRLDYDGGAILLLDKESGVLRVSEMFGCSRMDPDAAGGVPIPEEMDKLSTTCYVEKKPLLFNNYDESRDETDGITGMAGKLRLKAFICCPIICAEEALGVLVVGNTTTRRFLLQSEIDLLMLVGQEIGMAVQNLALRRTEKALRESSALFRAVVERSGDILLLTNVEGKVLYVSPPVNEVLGYSSSDLIDRRALGLVHPDDLHLVEKAMSRIRQNPGVSRNVTARVRHKDGSWLWVEVTSRNLLSEPGVGAIVSNLRDVSDRKKAQGALEESERKFKDLAEKAMVGVYLVQDGIFEYVNSKCAEIHGYDRPDKMEGLPVKEFVFPDDMEIVEKKKDAVEGNGEAQGQPFRIVRSDGQVRHVETYGRSTTYRGKPATIGMIVDATDRRNAEHALLWKTTFLEALVHSSRDGILVLDNHMRRVAQNQRLVDMWNMPPDVASSDDEEERVKFLMASIKNPDDFYRKLMHLYNQPDDTIRCEFELNDGTVVEAFSYPVLARDKAEQYGRIWMFRDITELRNYWDMLENLSTTDGLTGISNRRRLDEMLEREWLRGVRECSEISLLLIDIDYFKQYNDRYGHLAGDDCLIRVAAALKKSVRRGGDFVARYGGEEFVCILPKTGEKDAGRVAGRIMDEIASLNILHEDSMVADHLTVSIGVATMVPEKGQEHSDLIRAADQSLYAAKGEGRNRMAAAS